MNDHGLSGNHLGAFVSISDTTDASPASVNDWFTARYAANASELPRELTAQRWVSNDERAATVALHDIDGGAAPTGPDSTAEHADGPASAPFEAAEAVLPHFYHGAQILPGGLASPEGAGALFFIAMDAHPDIDVDFNRWYDEEHLVRLGNVGGVLAARRYRGHSGPQRYFAIYHVERADIVGSPEWLEAAETPWTHRVRPWTSNRVRYICRPAVGS